MAELRITPLIEETTAYVIARQRLWLTAGRDRLVPDLHPDAASLFVAAGHRISKADAVRYGLLETPEVAEDPEDAPEPEPEPPSDEDAPEPPAPAGKPRNRPRKEV